MKRLFAITVALIVATLQFACIKTDLSDCPPIISNTNLTVTFDLRPTSLMGTRADAEQPKFLDVVTNVDVYLFDENMRFVRQRRVETSELQQFCGTVFENIAPGQYNVVCWGNLSNRSSMPDLVPGTPFNGSYLHTNNTRTGGPIYYGPGKPIETFTYEGGGGMDPMPMRGGSSRADSVNYTIFQANVTAGQENVKPMEFDNVHRKVQVYIDGWEYADFYDGMPPVIEDCDVSNRFDFFLRADNTPMSFVQTSVLTTTPEGPMYGALFYSALIPLTEPMGLCLYNQTDATIDMGEPPLTIHFEDWMTENDWNNSGDLAILITFFPDGDGDGNGVSVSVTVPSWLRHEVQPEF